MEENFAPECDSEPLSKRPKTNLELTFSSHLELATQLGSFKNSDPTLINPPDCENTNIILDNSGSNHNSPKDYSFSNVNMSCDSDLASVSATATNEEVLIPITDPPSEDVAYLSTESAASTIEVACEYEQKGSDSNLSKVTPMQPENEGQTDPSTKEDTVEKVESQESGSDVEVVQAKINTKKKHKTVHQRKDIRKILSVDKLEEETLAAQREESERRQRQRLLQRQQAMTRAGQSWPFSVEDVMKKMANKGITMTIAGDSVPSTSCSSGNGETNNKNSIAPLESEHEVFTLSSDDEESELVKPIVKNSTFNLSNSAAFPTEFYGSRVVMNNCGGIVTGGLNGDANKVTQIISGEIQLEDKNKGEDSDSSDCMVISPPTNEEEDDTIEKYDDDNNMPDEFGRILVNVGHPPEDEDIFLSPQIGKAVKPHQIGGIRFLYDNVVESMERFNTTAGLGCILAHSMGLGKTIQAAAFCDVFLRHTKGNTVLIIVPINTVQNWLNEFNQWLPPIQRIDSTPIRKYSRKKEKLKTKSQELIELNDCESGMSSVSNSNHTQSSNFLSQSQQFQSPENLVPEIIPDQVSGVEAPVPVETKCPYEGRSFGIYVLNETVKTLAARGRIISEWTENRGVLLIGYEMYRMLSLKKLKKCVKKEKLRLNSPEEENAKLLKATHEDSILDKIHSCLVRPGPDLVICDEGHRIKNSGASISQALKAIKTRRRVVLTGYPLQNNLMEYWCMVDFIRPSYLGTKAEFSNMFERPITNGQCADSTTSDKRLMQFRSHVLHSLLEGFVQRRSHLVLQKALPPKQEWVFLLKMTSIQYELYKEFISYLRLMAEIGNSTPNPIKAFAVCCKIWNHPDVLYNVLKKKQSILEDFEGLTEEVAGSKPRKTGGKKDRTIPPDMNDNNFYTTKCPEVEDSDSLPIFTNFGFGPGPSSSSSRDNRAADSLLSLEWAASAFKDYVPGSLENGTKFELLFIVIEECLQVNDKLLVFSQSLLTLGLIETFLSLKFGWTKGREYFRLDGSTGGLERERLINEFNGQNSAVHVFLVSTRAGSLGINLIGANRVVVFDASWNPCHDCQAVCRVYRYGQKKECQIYRFVTDCTLEKRIYDRQINKRGMANRVVDEMNPESHFNSKDMSSTLHLEIDDLDRIQETCYKHDPLNYLDPIMQIVLSKAGSKITKEPFEHESLLIDRKEKKLSASERRMAHRNYEFEKKAAANQVPLPNLTPIRQPYPPQYGFSGYQGQGMSLPMTNPGAPEMSGVNYEGSGNYNLYEQGGHMGYYDRQVSGLKQHQQPFDYNVNGMPMPSQPGEVLPLPFDELKRKGISVQTIVLRKDSYLADPEGGSDIYLREGDQVYLLRSYRGSYLRLSNGRIIALRRRSKTNSFLDHIPPSQDLTKEQILHVINSIFKPKTTSISSSGSGHSYEPYRPSHSLRQNNSEAVDTNFSNQTNQFPYHHSMSVPLPPSHLYGNFLNHRNLQITNQRSSSGGDVTIWKKDSEKLKGQNQKDVDLIPDIEVIKLNPSESTTHKNYTTTSAGSSSSQGQPLLKNVPFSHSSLPNFATLANHTYPVPTVSEGRRNPTIMNALMSRHNRPTQKSYQGPSSNNRIFNQSTSIRTPQIPALPSELTIQPVPAVPTRSTSNETEPGEIFNTQDLWMASGGANNKLQFQNFSRLLSSSKVPEQYYTDSADTSRTDTDFLEAGQELLAEIMNPNQNCSTIFNKSRKKSNDKTDMYSSLPNPFYLNRGGAHTSTNSNSECFVDDKQASENGVISLNQGNNVFYDNSLPTNNGMSEAANISHFGQYYCISTAESQSFTPQS